MKVDDRVKCVKSPTHLSIPIGSMGTVVRVLPPTDMRLRIFYVALDNGDRIAFYESEIEEVK